jgi:hypothetical protein
MLASEAHDAANCYGAEQQKQAMQQTRRRRSLMQLKRSVARGLSRSTRAA